MSAVPATALPASLQRLQDAFLRLPAEANALQAVRRANLEKFLARGFPTIRDEHWKYTPLRRLEAQEFAFAERGSTNVPVSNFGDAYRLVFVDGLYQRQLSALPMQPGVRVKTLSDLAQSAAQQLAQILDIKANDTCRFVALNTALTQEGLLIELDANASLDKPLQLSFVWNGSERGFMAHPRIVVRAGAYSKLVMLEEYSGTAAASHWTNAVTTLELGEGASIEHHRLQNEPTNAFHIGLLHTELAAHAQLVSHNFNLGASLGRLDINAFLQGPEAAIELNGLQFATGHQHHDTHTRVHHCVVNTRSNEDYRGIADQRGRVVFNGKVVVHEKAIRTDAKQSSRNLLLARTAEIDTKPELEIYADDVKCAHGATVGQLDATALFYLRSRGLGETEARALLTQAFADAVISRASLAALREKVADGVHARFGYQLESP